MASCHLSILTDSSTVPRLESWATAHTFVLSVDSEAWSNCHFAQTVLDTLLGLPAPPTAWDELYARDALSCIVLRLPRSRTDPPAHTLRTLRLLRCRPWREVREGLQAYGVVSPRVSSVARVSAYIERWYSRPLRLDALARVAGLSVRGLTEAFRDAHHCTVHEYVARKRATSAVHLLATTDEKVEWVAAQCGFGSSSCLYRTVRRLTGSGLRARHDRAALRALQAKLQGEQPP